MTGNTDRIRPWDIWWALVHFEDTDQVKRRPVIILDTEEMFVISLKVTSHEARHQWGEYEILYWKSAGLPKPSTVRLTQILKLQYQSLDKPIGTLHSIDIVNIQDLLQ